MALDLIYGRDAEIVAWLNARTPGLPEGTAIGVARDGILIAGIAYTRFTGAAVEMAIAADRPSWASPRVLAALFAYPFVQLGCRRVTAITARRNKRCRRLLEGVGFVLEGKARHALPDDDAMIYGMLRRECRWINPQARKAPR